MPNFRLLGSPIRYAHVIFTSADLRRRELQLAHIRLSAYTRSSTEAGLAAGESRG